MHRIPEFGPAELGAEPNKKRKAHGCLGTQSISSAFNPARNPRDLVRNAAHGEDRLDAHDRTLLLRALRPTVHKNYEPQVT